MSELHEYVDRCDWALSISENESMSLIDYNQFIFCGFDENNLQLAIGICLIWLLLLFIALAVTATDFLCPSLFVISKTLGLSQNVAGVTLIAFGNGSVDIFAAISGMRQGRPDLVIGDLLGGGIFVTMFVVGTLFAIKPFKVLAVPFFRDILFYLFALSWMFYLFVVVEEIRLHDAVGFLFLYVIYVIVVIICGKYDNTPAGGGHGHSHAGSTADEEGITFEGITPDIDPLADMVVMKGFVMLRDRPPPVERITHQQTLTIIKASNLPGIIPIIKVTPNEEDSKSMKTDISASSDQKRTPRGSRVSICEESVYSTINSLSEIYGRGESRSRSRASSIFSISQTQRLQIRRASREFLEKITPIDMIQWRRQNWGSRGLEIIKSPIRFFLLLTTPMADVEDKNEWNKFHSVLHCISGPVFVIYAIGLGKFYVHKYVPLAAAIFLVAMIISFVVVFTSKFETPPSYYKAYSSYLGFVVATTWIYVISNEAVSLIRTIGITFDIEEVTIGMTLLAWGNCFLDFIANIAIAKKGFPRMAVAACIGAPLLSLLIGVGVPASIKLASDPQATIKLIPSDLIVIIYGALSIALILTMLVTAILKLRASRYYGIFIVVVYLLLIIFVILIELRVIDFTIFFGF